MNIQDEAYYKEQKFERDISEEAVKEKRYLWMARTFALVAVVSLITTFMLLGALLSLQPLVRVQPFYMNAINKNQQVINVERPNFKNINIPLLSESFIRQYLLTRFTIGPNVDELERRWGIDGDINWMSETSVFNEFTPEATKLVEQARDEGFTRNVRILVVSPYRQANGQNIWRVELEFTDMKQDQTTPIKTKYVASLDITFNPSKKGLTWDQRLKNPLGFTVKRFGIQKL